MLDFGAMLASKIEPKTGPKIGRLTNQKIDSRVGGGSIFEGQGSPKSMKNRCQNVFKISSIFKTEQITKKFPT